MKKYISKRFCAYIYDFKGILEKKTVNFLIPEKSIGFKVKNQPSRNPKFFSRIKMYANIMQNAAFESAKI